MEKLRVKQFKTFDWIKSCVRLAIHFFAHELEEEWWKGLKCWKKKRERKSLKKKEKKKTVKNRDNRITEIQSTS